MIEIKVLFNGVHHHYEKDGIKYIDDITSAVGLIQAEGKNILVDCGSVFYENKLVDALKENSLGINEIDFIILTHTHPDHLGNFHLFSQSKMIDAPTVIDLKDKLYTKYPKNSDLPLPKGIEIINTSGHTLPHFSVIVTKDNKSIVFSGDAIKPEMLEENYLPEGQDIPKMIESALKICEIADEIIPGHGLNLQKEEILKIKNNLLKLRT